MTKTTDHKSVSLAFFGDVMLGGEFLRYAQRNGCDLVSPFRYVEKHFLAADLSLINLEGPLAAGENRRQDVTTILSNHPSLLDYLMNHGTIVVNLANNHMMDYGRDGLAATIGALDARGIPHVGAGMDEEEANRPLIIDRNGMRVGFLSYTSNEPHIGAILAGPNSPGCASFLDLDKVVSQVEHLKTRVDVMCVSMHWGHEYFFYPDFQQVKIAHKLANAGANFIVGHHPHVIQGIQQVKNALVMYSLGNCFLPPFRSIYGRVGYRKRGSKEFMIVECKADSIMGIEHSIIGGTVNKEYLLTPLGDVQQTAFYDKINSLSGQIAGSDYETFWGDYRSRREKELMKEGLVEAVKKVLSMPLREILKTVTLNDIKRNIQRMVKIAFK